jgi:hypothetical protein
VGFTPPLHLRGVEPGSAMLCVPMTHVPLLGSFMLGNPLPFDKFAGQFAACIRLR